MHWLWTNDGQITDADGLRMEASDELDTYATDWEATLYAIREGWEPITECNQCERPLPEDHMRMLCERCEGVARATARYFPEGPDKFKERASV